MRSRRRYTEHTFEESAEIIKWGCKDSRFGDNRETINTDMTEIMKKQLDTDTTEIMEKRLNADMTEIMEVV